MKYIQIFEGSNLIKEINDFKKDFKASELTPLLPQDWQSFASQDDSFIAIWKPDTIEAEEAIRFVEIIIAKNFEWEDTASMILFQKASEAGTVLDSAGELKAFEVPKEELVSYLKSFEHKDKINILSTNPSRGLFYIAVNIKQEAWDQRLYVISSIAEWISLNQLEVEVSEPDA